MRQTTSAPWENVRYGEVRSLYDKRFETHLELIRMFQGQSVEGYVKLALGISDPSGNYSASRHGLGPKILASSTPQQVFDLAGKLFNCGSAQEIPDIIYRENLPYLKISVGSEMAALLRPDVFWVTNVRTVWAQLVLKHGNVERANEELRLYGDPDPVRDSQMRYQIWRELHQLVGPSLEKLALLGNQAAAKQNINPGPLKYLWADAIADTLYNEYTG